MVKKKLLRVKRKQPKMQLSSSFNYGGESHSIKKVEDGFIYTTGGRMFRQSTLESNGVKFTQSEIPKRKRPLTPKQKEMIRDEYYDAKDNLQDAKQKLSDLKTQLRELYSEMDAEAGQKGDDWSDADANRYGEDMNNLEEKIQKQKEIVKEASDRYNTADEKYWETY